MTDIASEPVVSRVSPQECARRIHRVLVDREEWLHAHNLPIDYQMTVQDRGEFLEWSMERFQETPVEAELIARDRRHGKTVGQIRKAVRSRWNLEKQRRAGSSQVWELLSYTGDASPEFLKEALQPKSNNGSGERVDTNLESESSTQGRKSKDDLRYGKMLQRRVQTVSGFAETLNTWQSRLLQEAKDGSLKRKVNTAVVEAGRGRLRGDNDDDYIDIGTNQDRSVVQHILDGKRPKPDTTRFAYE